jgi:tetratricopeptide (TPR) repeat protein
MLDRVGRAVERRIHFMPVYKMIENGDLDLAIKTCEVGERENAKMATDFLRLRAECTLTMGRAADAEALYRQLIEARSVGWATLGLARTLFMQNRFAEAEEELTKLIAESDKFLDAYDLLAKTRQAMGKFEEAKNILASAVEISPHAIRRLRTLGKLALDTGDIVAAESLLTRVVGKSRYSEFRDAEDHVHLVTALVQNGDTKQATTMIRDLEKTFSGQAKTKVCKELLNGMLNDSIGETELAATNYASAVALFKDAEGLSSDIKLSLAKNCLEHDMEGEASTILLDVMNNAKDKAASDKALAVFADAGYGDLAQKVAQESRQLVVALLSSGAAKAKAGDFLGAVAEMTQAAQQMPENAQVIFNAAVAALKCLENVAWDDALGANARWYIDTARRLDPANARLATLVGLYISILRKYNIPASQVTPVPPARI